VVGDQRAEPAEAERFANEIAKHFPGKMLAYNCSPSFNWQKKLSPEDIKNFQRLIGAMGYKFQLVTLAGFHTLNHSMFKLAHAYKDEGMAAYSQLQQAEFASEADGYTATRHQRKVGVSYFDAVAMAISGGKSSTTAFAGSTEADQFHDHDEPAITPAPAASPVYHDHDEGLVHAHEWATSAPQMR
jgi:isocitrate lyase